MADAPAPEARAVVIVDGLRVRPTMGDAIKLVNKLVVRLLPEIRGSYHVHVLPKGGLQIRCPRYCAEALLSVENIGAIREICGLESSVSSPLSRAQKRERNAGLCERRVFIRTGLPGLELTPANVGTALLERGIRGDSIEFVKVFAGDQSAFVQFTETDPARALVQAGTLPVKLDGKNVVLRVRPFTVENPSGRAPNQARRAQQPHADEPVPSAPQRAAGNAPRSYAQAARRQEPAVEEHHGLPLGKEEADDDEGFVVVDRSRARQRQQGQRQKPAAHREFGEVRVLPRGGDRTRDAGNSDHELRELLGELREELQGLRGELTALRQQNSGLQSQIADLKQQNKQLRAAAKAARDGTEQRRTSAAASHSAARSTATEPARRSERQNATEAQRTVADDMDLEQAEPAAAAQ
jgi:hypothetical protein